MNNITVIGAGNSGLATAAYLSINGHSVRLWNRSKSTIKKLINTKLIHLKGIINQDAKLDIVTTDIVKATRDTALIMVTTPATSHVSIANLLSKTLDPHVPIILNPGRTFGALDFGNTLSSTNSKIPTIAETQTIVFTCRKTSEDTSIILAMKKGVLISTLRKNDITSLINSIPACLKDNFKPTNSMLLTSIGNVGMILHCAPVLLNAGWIECETASFKYYYSGITKTISEFLQKVDDERVQVSKALCSPVESLIGWLKRSYNAKGKNLYDCIHDVKSYETIDAPRTLQHRYIFEDIPTGLVPLEALGLKLGLSMKYTSIIIDLAHMLLNTDFRESGRNLTNLELNMLSTDELIEKLSNRN
ncbi:MAG: NAD/NADP octopine/nopaline dehydrogenase family protein [Candidatus Cloacimonetes bacterium]|nr:NAD/NADP octopine/nopaline dehydrogenase family protein [Candidatus Cloacimonadota bacterium]